VKKLARQLEDLGYPVAALQGNLSQGARERVMSDFRQGGVPILVATNVAARGLDVAGIERVINYELPETAELFTHRAGRTGRMGNDGEAITFVTPEDASKWWQIERALGHRLPRQVWPKSRTAAPAPGSPAPSARPAPAATASSSRFVSRPATPARTAPAGGYRFKTSSHGRSHSLAPGGRQRQLT
jgi:superfamily II DNA/RNA helicase